MEEIRKNTLKSGLSELEKIFQEYKSKLEHAEQESDEIIDAAWQKAEIIIADKQKEAQQIADEMEQKARREADRTILEAKTRAAAIEKEAADRTRKEAKDKTNKAVERIIADTKQKAESDSAKIIDQARKEAEDIVRKARESTEAQVFEQSEAIIDEAKEKAKSIYEDAIAHAEETSHLIVEVLQKADDILNRLNTQVKSELTDLSARFDKSRDNLEMKSILGKSEAVANDRNGRSGNGQFKGRLELYIVQPYDRGQIKKLVSALKQIPNVKFGGEAGTEDNFSIYLDIAEPTPLNNILQKLSLVESSNVSGDTIKLKLKDRNNNA